MPNQPGHSPDRGRAPGLVRPQSRGPAGTLNSSSFTRRPASRGRPSRAARALAAAAAERYGRVGGGPLPDRDLRSGPRRDRLRERLRADGADRLVLAGEVVAERPQRDIRLGRDVLDGDVLQAPLDGQPQCGRTQCLPDRELLAFPQPATPAGRTTCRRRSADRHHRLGDSPGRPPARICPGTGLGVGSGPLETAFRLRHALGLLADPGDPAVVGTIEEHLAQL